MSQNSNANNSDLLNDYFTVASDPDMSRLNFGFLLRDPQILFFSLNVMQRYPELAADYIRIEANRIRALDQNMTLTQEKEMLAKQNQ